MMVILPGTRGGSGYLMHDKTHYSSTDGGSNESKDYTRGSSSRTLFTSAIPQLMNMPIAYDIVMTAENSEDRKKMKGVDRMMG